jgi:hypothetical protein
VILAARLLRALVGAAFAAAGLGKLLDADAPRIGPLLVGAAPGWAGLLVAAFEDALPWLELVVALATWAAAGRLARHALAVGLGALFLAVAWAIPDGVRCGCLGALGDFESRAAHAAVAACLLGLSVALLIVERKACDGRDLRKERRIPACEAT